MRTVYFISPVGSDPNYLAKREVLSDVAATQGVEFFFPLDRHEVFSVAVAAQDIRDAWLVIADLSLERPSCYFEVGLAQGVGAPVAFLAAEAAVLHQAGISRELIRYSNLETYKASVLELLAQRKRGDA